MSVIEKGLSWRDGEGLTTFIPRTPNLNTILPHHLCEMPRGLRKPRFTPVVVYAFKAPCVYGIDEVFVAYCEVLADTWVMLFLLHMLAFRQQAIRMRIQEGRESGKAYRMCPDTLLCPF